MDIRLYGIGLVAIFAIGYFAGWSGEHDKLVAFRSSVEQAAKSQTAQTKITEAENDKQTYAVARAYGTELDRLNANLDRLRNKSASPSPLPPATVDTPVVGASCPQPGGVTACDAGGDPCTVSRDFWERALNDALDWTAVQDWLVRVRIPVSE